MIILSKEITIQPSRDYVKIILMMKSSLLQTGQYSGSVATLQYLNGLIIGTTVYEKENFKRDFHYHENPHLTFILQGGNLENRRHQSRELKVGDVVFYHSGEFHQTLPAANFSRNINLEIENSFLEKFEISESEIYTAVRRNPDSKFLILKMYKELLVSDNLSESSIQILLLNAVSSSQKLANHQPEWVVRLYEILHDQWNEYHNLADLSDELKVHPVTISKYFSKYFGCTLGEYVRKIRVEKSLAMIRSNRHMLTEIGLECGFFDQTHFTRNFKALTGFLPKEFRQL